MIEIINLKMTNNFANDQNISYRTIDIIAWIFTLYDQFLI